MKVAMITPHYHQARGNTITVQRISASLRLLGIETTVISITPPTDYPDLPPSADLVHGFNAYEFGLYWRKKYREDTPYVITMTGTDVNHNLLDPESRDIVVEALSGAKAVHVFNDEARTLLWKEIPEIREKTYQIAQGITMFSSSSGAEKQKSNEFIFLLPAGIRKVKNVPKAIRMLESLHQRKPFIRLWLVGPILEEAEGKQVAELVDRHRDWVRYIGQIDHRAMGELYQKADVVLNTSLSEGQSSAILEAMAAGIPVLVSDIPGNRDVVSHGEQGFLYRDGTEFLLLAEHLMQDETLRTKLGEEGRKYVQANHSPEHEVKEIAAMYRMSKG